MAGRWEVVKVEKASTSSTSSLSSCSGRLTGARESVSVVTWCFPVLYILNLILVCHKSYAETNDMGRHL